MQFTSLVALTLSLTASASALATCHQSGVWAQRTDGLSKLSQACNRLDGSYGAGNLKSICINGANNIRWNFEVQKANAGNGVVDHSTCVARLSNIISDCGGQNADTCGGTATYNIAGHSYKFSVDPNTGAC